ncbi:MAG: glycosyltransferase, partial [Thermoleophilia bacterium]|nr:glycosyltransferase [Thermoleophilia bacterium]
ATAVDGTPEAVRDGETGLLVPPRQPEPLANALRRLLDDPSGAQRMRERAIEIASDLYTWDANARSYDEIYTSLTT